MDTVGSLVGDVVSDALSGGADGEGEVDFIANIRGVYDSFLFDDEAYMSIVGGTAIDSVTGRQAGTVLSAPSSGNRPAWDGSDTATFTAGSAHHLVGGAALAAEIDGVKPMTVVARVSYTGTGYYTPVGMGWSGGDIYWGEPINRRSSGESREAGSVRWDGSDFAIATGASLTDGVTYNQAVTFSGSSLTVWVDGTAGTPLATTSTMTGIDLFAIGGFPYESTIDDVHNGTVRAVIVCTVVLTSEEIGAVGSYLATRFP